MPLNSPDIKELQAIVDWVNLTEDIRELSIKFGDVELFVSRDRQLSSNGGPTVLAASAPSAAPAAPTPAATRSTAAVMDTAPAGAPEAERPLASSSGDLAADEVLIKAPMVGTFYGSPKPGAPAFVVVGDEVRADSVLGIVEVMKLMNNIEAQVEGTVARILVENEQAVEYGQPLLVIRRHG